VQIVVFTKASADTSGDNKQVQLKQLKQREQQEQETSSEEKGQEQAKKMTTTVNLAERDLHGYALFSAAATSLFNTWPIFTFSRTHETGGNDTEKKIERIIEDALYNFEERWKLAISGRVGERPKLSRVYVDEMAPFLYEVLESDLSMQLEDGSPEVISAHIIRMFDQCLEGDFTEAHQALAFERKQKRKESSARMSLADEGRQATAVFHQQGEEDDGDLSPAPNSTMIEEPKKWIPCATMVECFDIHTHGDGERSHGNSTTESASSFSKSVKHATKRAGKQTRQKSSWNKGGNH
jgi:hypothetical protein